MQREVDLFRSDIVEHCRLLDAWARSKSDQELVGYSQINPDVLMNVLRSRLEPLAEQVGAVLDALRDQPPSSGESEP